MVPFAKTQAPLPWVLAEAWPLDWSKTTKEKDARRQRRLNDHLLRVRLAKSQREICLQADERRCKAEEAVEYMHHECDTMAGDECRYGWSGFLHWRDDDVGVDDGVVGLKGHAYEMIVRYLP